MRPIDEKLCSVETAVGKISSGDCVACGGFIGAGHPESVTKTIEKQFLEKGTPNNLTLVYAAGQGDAKDRGGNHFGHKGLVKKVIGGHWGLAPKLGKLAIDGDIEAYNFPQGVICQLFRDIAAGRPGCITHIGLGTFIDPEVDGGCVNERTTRGAVERIELGGKTWLWYKSFPINVGLIRATSADVNGNLVMDRESMFGDMLAIAQAAHNSGGVVIAQVKELKKDLANPHHVSVPGILVDHIVVADPGDHQQTFSEDYNSAYCTSKPDDVQLSDMESMALNERRIIAARVCDDIPRGAIVNLGLGMPEGVAKIAAERGLIDDFTLTVESGPIGGVPASCLSFGASTYPQAIIDQPAMFDFYDGRGLDFASLGMAQIDSEGNVNVSKFGPKLAGVGGFVNITQTAKKLTFCGTFTAVGLKVVIRDGVLEIVSEGKVRKFVKQIEQISFSAAQSRRVGQDVLYITERCVFRLTEAGLELIEVADGINIQTQILALMDFEPIIKDVKRMAKHLFAMPG